MVTENVLEMQNHLRAAVEQLDAAADNTSCGWCIKSIKQTAGVLGDISALSSYTDLTARKVRSMTEKQLRALGGKVGALRTVVREESETSPITSEIFNRDNGDAYGRGISMDKKSATNIVLSEVALGAGMGFLANRLEAQYGNMFGLGTSWYTRMSPLINLGAGLAFVMLGISGKSLFKGEKMRMLGVAGGGAMIANAALQYLEGFYANMGAPQAMVPRGRAYAPAATARPVGVIPPRMVNTMSF